MSILNALFSTPMTAVTSGPGIISLGMTPRTQAGFDFMKGFDQGAITGIMDETSTAQDIEDFGKGIMAADAANKTPINQGGIISATPIFASEDIAARNVGVPQRILKIKSWQI